MGCPLHGGASGVSVPYGNVQATPAEQGATETGRPSFRDIGALCFVPTRLFTTRVGLTDTAGLESEWAKAPYCPSLRVSTDSVPQLFDTGPSTPAARRRPEGPRGLSFMSSWSDVCASFRNQPSVSVWPSLIDQGTAISGKLIIKTGRWGLKKLKGLLTFRRQGNKGYISAPIRVA